MQNQIAADSHQTGAGEIGHSRSADRKIERRRAGNRTTADEFVVARVKWCAGVVVHRDEARAQIQAARRDIQSRVRGVAGETRRGDVQGGGPAAQMDHTRECGGSTGRSVGRQARAGAQRVGRECRHIERGARCDLHTGTGVHGSARSQGQCPGVDRGRAAVGVSVGENQRARAILGQGIDAGAAAIAIRKVGGDRQGDTACDAHGVADIAECRTTQSGVRAGAGRGRYAIDAHAVGIGEGQGGGARAAAVGREAQAAQRMICTRKSEVQRRIGGVGDGGVGEVDEERRGRHCGHGDIVNDG